MISRPLVILGSLIFGSVGLAAAAWAILNLGRGSFLTSLVYAGISAFCLGLIIPYIKMVPGRVCPRVEWDSSGTTVRPDRGIDMPVIVSMSGLVIATGAFAIFFPLDAVDIPVPHEMRLYLPFIAAATALLGAPVALRAIRRGSTKCLRLTPDGLEIVLGWRPRVVQWAHVLDVTDSVPNQAPISSSTVAVILDDETALRLPAGAMTPGGTALRQWVRFYWEHPDQRIELTDGRALDRLRAEDFTITL